MKRFATLIALAAVVVLVSQLQAAYAKHGRVYSAAVPAYGYGYGGGYTDYGGATVFPDGSFTNNGYSWNGADPAGGWTGNYTQPGAGRYGARMGAVVHTGSRRHR